MLIKCGTKLKMDLFYKIIVITASLGFIYPVVLGDNIFRNHMQKEVATYEKRNLPNETKENCTPAAINEFPSDGLTREQRRAGWITIHVLLTSYCFIILSIVCDEYFVPGIQTLVERLQLSEDVAGASFMAITSASPELFINCVGTFITEGDIGVGTVVGSNVFNILAVPACCGMFAKMAFQFELWSILRDGFMYAISVIMLIATLYDDKVQWYEALAFVLAYFIYILVMYFDKSIRKKIYYCCGRPRDSPANHELDTLNENKEKQRLPHVIDEYTLLNVIDEPNLTDQHSSNLKEEHPPGLTNQHLAPLKNDNSKSLIQKQENIKSDEQIWDIWIFPSAQSFYKKMWWVLIWPISFVLKYTVPDCKKRGVLFPFTLLMCMFWIGCTSYLLAWLITAIGDTISIPDSVMGLSFLAVGSSMPEIVSCIIVSKQGQGIMGMSSALGANTFEVLLCLGLPWLIKTCFYPKVKGSHWIDINSSGLAYNATCLLSTLVFLYICLFFNRFRLDWKVGFICLIMYGVFLVVGTLMELNFFFPVNLPTCT